MNGPRMDDLPYESLLGLENVRKLEITYNRRHPWEGVCAGEDDTDRAVGDAA